MKAAQDKDRTLQAAIYQRTLPHCTTITAEQARTLRRAELTLHRWAELECGGTNENYSCEVHRVTDLKGRERVELITRSNRTPQRWAQFIPDREAGALRRVAAVCKAAGLHYFHQTDPRGCALYVSTQPLTDTNYSNGVPCSVR